MDGLAVDVEEDDIGVGGDPNDPTSTTNNVIQAYIDNSSVTADTILVDATSASDMPHSVATAAVTATVTAAQGRPNCSATPGATPRRR